MSPSLITRMLHLPEFTEVLTWRLKNWAHGSTSSMSARKWNMSLLGL